MAAYDMMGNYTGYEDESYAAPVSPYDFEEEERRKEQLRRELEAAQKAQEELASEVSRKEEITEYGDGHRTVKTTKEIPAGRGPVAPDDYNARIAQQESGGRADIGYHDRSKGTASGLYGMTDAGYADARRVNPDLPADRLQSTPEQQTAAMNAYTQQNAKYLQNYGIEPTQNNLAAAHFLGAKGLSDYLKTGQISEAAAKANGGADNVRRIVNQRLGGQPAAASGAANLMPGETAGMPTQRPQPISPEQAAAQPAPTMEGVNAGQGIRMPGQGAATQGADGSKNYIDRYQEDQNDPNKLMQLSSDETAPAFLRERSRNRAADLITQQRDMQAAQEKLAAATPTELAKYMREKTTGGSWVKAIFYAAIGAKQLAQEEGAKLGIGSEKVVTDANGNANIIKVSSNGTPLEGYSAVTGKKLSAEELVGAMGGAADKDKNKVSTSAEQFQDKDGNIYRSQSDEKGKLVTRNIVTGEVYRGDPTKLTRVRDVASQTAADRQQGFKRENMTTEQANRLQVLQTQLGNDLTKAKLKDRLDIFSNYNKALQAENLPTLTMAEMGLNPDGSLASERAQTAPATAPAPIQTAPGAAPAAGRVTPVAPAPLPGQTSTAVTPVSPTTAVQGQGPGARPSLSEINRQKEIDKSQREVAETGAKEEVKKITDMRIALPKTERATASTLKVIDDVLSHPGFSDVIGMPNIITGIYSAPTTNARDFKQKYEQLKGKAFMEAYNGMRGTGSITEAEGMRAETAIAALNDPYISEKEFKRNAEIFKSALRNGIDNERIQVGQEPRYKKFSAEEQSAFEWLKKNPKDPRADAVRLRLERAGD